MIIGELRKEIKILKENYILLYVLENIKSLKCIIKWYILSYMFYYNGWYKYIYVFEIIDVRW